LDWAYAYPMAIVMRIGLLKNFIRLRIVVRLRGWRF